MRSWLWWHRYHFMQQIGFRRFHYFPGRHYIKCADFSRWKYRPDLPMGDYDESPKKHFGYFWQG